MTGNMQNLVTVRFMGNVLLHWIQKTKIIFNINKVCKNIINTRIF